MCVGSRVRLVGVSISFEKNFYQLPFTPPSLVRRIGSSDGSFRHCRPPFIPASTVVGSSTSSPPSLGYQKFCGGESRGGIRSEEKDDKLMGEGGERRGGD